MMRTVNYFNFKEINDNPEQLNDLVKNKPTFVRYHMNGCGHCVAMEEEWKKFLNNMSDRDNINIVNVEQSVMDKISQVLTSSVQGFPTLLLYTNNGNKQTQYNGERTAEAFKSWLATQIQSNVGKNNRNTIKKRKLNKKQYSKNRKSVKRIKKIKRKNPKKKTIAKRKTK